MNDYTGKICPYCKTEFKPDDDIIVCSECDMPHHKDCWVENQGCTTFGCLGTIKAADNAASSVTATQMNFEESASAPTEEVVYCAKCGAQNSNEHSFCTRCGNRLTTAREPSAPVYTQANPANNNPYSYVNQQNTQYQSQNNCQTGYNAYQTYQTYDVDPDMVQLIGAKTEYYIPKFREMKIQNKSTSWNWAAFLVAPYWFLYRKMYVYGAIALAADFVISLIGSGFLSFLALGAYIVIGILGNSIYMKYLEGKAEQAKVMGESYKSQFINANGGVNSTATILAVVGRAVLAGILLA